MKRSGIIVGIGPLSVFLLKTMCEMRSKAEKEEFEK